MNDAQAIAAGYLEKAQGDPVEALLLLAADASEIERTALSARQNQSRGYLRRER